MMMKTTLALAATAALAASPAAFADKQGFYVGVDGGMSSVDVSKSSVDDLLLGSLDITSGSSKLDDSDISFGVFAGYRFNSYLAIEGAYIDLGSAEYQASGVVNAGGTPVDANAKATLDSSGAALSVLGILPLHDNWDVYLRAGVFFADTELKGQVTLDGTTDSGRFSRSGESFLWGVGGSYHFNDQWSARLEYTQFMDVGDKDSFGESDVDRVTLGVTYKFR